MGVQTNSYILFITNGSLRADDGDNQPFWFRFVTQPQQSTTLWVLSVNSILGRCEALWNIQIHTEYFHTYSVHNRRHKNRKRKVLCTDSGRFTQLYLKHSQFREYFILNYKKRFDKKWLFFAFSLALFTMYLFDRQLETYCPFIISRKV